MKPERHVWDEGSTHRAVAGKEYDEVWDYAEELEAELEKITCHWCEAEVTEDEANEHYKSCTKNPLRAENEALTRDSGALAGIVATSSHGEGCYAEHWWDSSCDCGLMDVVMQLHKDAQKLVAVKRKEFDALLTGVDDDM